MQKSLLLVDIFFAGSVIEVIAQPNFIHVIA